ncbi:AAA family ATPase [Brevundimonas mediterranea]|uniref:Energy-coupling factor transporter ATP-binding protein EcfA2 n=1 Tax=Brevundimonas mediterranea TaxID=74329 RepID=A0A7W6A6Y7_9CAUL|nr:energy-coupling factor transporter ATP-binding protein EcfA2 [Brevundimonas mediterranea]
MAAIPPRPRIDRLSIQNFRGFPGLGNPEIRFGGKNLLIYGENGSGKSSIFHALDQLFSVAEPDALSRQALIQRETNVFSGLPPADTLISVQFMDAPAGTIQPISWTEASHPLDQTGTTFVVEAAYGKAMLDYRSLLAVNYRHLGGRINLFDAFTSVIARDMAVPIGGTQERLIDLWQAVVSKFALRHAPSRVTAINDQLDAVNSAIDLMLEPLRIETNRLLRALDWSDLEIETFSFSHLSVPWSSPLADRSIQGQEIFFTLTQRTVTIDEPHQFLNEARQSGLALALYLAGRTIMAATMQATAPKLLVLDDVLIGLDQSNRLPVLRLLQAEFSDWQIVLLTHDRVWFEMARATLPPTGDGGWAGIEIFEGVDASGGTHPVLRPLDNFDPVLGNIGTARSFLVAHHEKAAAVHARMAFEQALKKVCDRKSVPIAFRSDPRYLTTQDLLQGLKTWLADPRRAPQKVALDPRIATVEAARRVVLNAFAHSTPVTLVRGEIEAAIDAVEALHTELGTQLP